MADVLEQLDTAYDEEVLGSGSPGTSMLLKWFKDGPWGEAAQHIIWQFIIFYTMLLVGFGFLYLMIRSTNKLREIRKEVAETLRTQQARRFDLENYSMMGYGGIA